MLWTTKGIKLVRLQIDHMEKDQRNARPHSSKIINPIMFSDWNLEFSLSHRDSKNTPSWPEKFMFILAGLWVEETPVPSGSAHMIHLHFEGYVWQGKEENFPLAKSKTKHCLLTEKFLVFVKHLIHHTKTTQQKINIFITKKMELLWKKTYALTTGNKEQRHHVKFRLIPFAPEKVLSSTVFWTYSCEQILYPSFNS